MNHSSTQEVMDSISQRYQNVQDLMLLTLQERLSADKLVDTLPLETGLPKFQKKKVKKRQKDQIMLN